MSTPNKDRIRAYRQRHARRLNTDSAEHGVLRILQPRRIAAADHDLAFSLDELAIIGATGDPDSSGIPDRADDAARAAVANDALRIL